MNPSSFTPFSFGELADQSRPSEEPRSFPLPSVGMSNSSNAADQAHGKTHLIFSGKSSSCPCAGCSTETQVAVVAGIEVIGCPNCYGFMTPRREFHKLVERIRKSYRGPEKPRPMDSAQLHEKRNCPKCLQPFETHAYAGPGTTVLDTCDRCESVWLDQGELERIEQAPGRR